jgi:hypothetical protein
LVPEKLREDEIQAADRINRMDRMDRMDLEEVIGRKGRSWKQRGDQKGGRNDVRTGAPEIRPWSSSYGEGI